jgi:hypothetical protein
VPNLSDRDYQLLTAYVDGELSARQRRMVLRLLRRLPSARTLLRHLEQDSQELRSLTRFKLPADFSDRVVQTLAMPNVARPASPAIGRPGGLPAWFAYAAAAVLLISVGVLAFTIFARGMKPAYDSQSVDVASHDRSEEEGVLAGAGSMTKDSSSDSGPADEGLPPVAINLRAELQKLPADPPLSDDRMRKDFGAASTDRRMEVFSNKEQVDVLHRTINNVRGLDAKDILSKLKQERSVRVDFACKNGTMACERLKGVVASAGISLITEQVAEYRLKHPKLDTNYVLYLEDLTPEELARILESLGREDQRADSSKSGEGQFSGLVLGRMTEADSKELKGLLGSYGKLLHVHLATGSGSQDLDPKKSLSTATPQEILNAPPRPEGSKSSGKSERLGLILPYNPVRPQRSSPEVRKFIESRKAPRPDTLQVLLVLHEPR